jgi:hypothetical protein
MNFDDVKLVNHRSTGARRFGYWVQIRDRRPVKDAAGVRGRKNILNFFSQSLGPLGGKWQYQKIDTEYILKLNDERDLLFLLLRLEG